MRMRIRYWFTALIGLILGGCQWFVIPAAAYMGPVWFKVKGKVKSKLSGIEIDGIRISLIEKSMTNVTCTTNHGAFEVNSYFRDFTVFAGDVDGKANFSYISTNFPVSLNGPVNGSYTLEILLYRKVDEK